VFSNQTIARRSNAFPFTHAAEQLQASSESEAIRTKSIACIALGSYTALIIQRPGAEVDRRGVDVKGEGRMFTPQREDLEQT
jgi:hypothetical protein